MGVYIYIYYTMREISSENIAFWSANIQRYYTVQQLIVQLSSARLLVCLHHCLLTVKLVFVFCLVLQTRQNTSDS